MNKEILSKLKYPILGGLGTAAIFGGGYGLVKAGTKDVPNQNPDPNPAENHNRAPDKPIQDQVPKVPPAGSVAAATSTTYQGTALGTVMGAYLMDSKQNGDQWKERHQKFQSARSTSKLFSLAKGAVAEQNKLHNKCEEMYTWSQDKWQSLGGEKGVHNEEDSRNLWKDTWDWCSLTQKEQDKPENWPWKNRAAA